MKQTRGQGLFLPDLNDHAITTPIGHGPHRARAMRARLASRLRGHRPAVPGQAL